MVASRNLLEGLRGHRSGLLGPLSARRVFWYPCFTTSLHGSPLEAGLNGVEAGSVVSTLLSPPWRCATTSPTLSSKRCGRRSPPTGKEAWWHYCSTSEHGQERLGWLGLPCIEWAGPTPRRLVAFPGRTPGMGHESQNGEAVFLLVLPIVAFFTGNRYWRAVAYHSQYPSVDSLGGPVTPQVFT
jgi:hypothetical protein